MLQFKKISTKIKSWTINYKIAAAITLTVIMVSGVIYQLAKPDQRIVKAHRQVETLAQEIRNFYRNKPDAWGLNTASAIKNQLVSADMVNDRLLQNALGKEVLLGADILGNTVMPGSKNAVIVYKNLDKRQCQSIISRNFNEKMLLSLNAVTIVNETEHKFSWGGKNPLPISADKAQSVCKEANDILWDIYL